MFKIVINPIEFENSIDLTPYVAIPLNMSYRLDESLDTFSITARNMPSEYNKPFRPFTTAYFFADDTQTDYEIFYISSDEVSRNIITNTYTHNIIFIEETKILERVMCDTRMFTQPKNLGTNARQPMLEFNDSAFYPITLDNYTSYLTLDKVTLPPATQNTSITIYSPAYLMTDLFVSIYNNALEENPSLSYVSVSFDLINDLGNVIQNIYSLKDVPRNALTYTTPTFELSANSTYKITYDFYIRRRERNAIYTYSATVTQTFVTVFNPKPEYTLYDVCQSILDTCRCRLENEQNQFSIANVPDTSKDYITTSFLQNTLSPEFTFAKSTLWEVFSIIGGYLNAIPKLINNQLYFEKMNKNGKSLLDTSYFNTYLIGEISSWSNEQYCNTIESDVDNLVDNENSFEGSLSEPNTQYFQTLRAESGTVQVTTDNSCFIRTDYPIAKIIKVECGYLPDGTYVGDITDYVYEQAEYNAYTGYSIQYPSKAMALTWTYGQHNITGLTFKAEQAWASAFGLELFNNYAIINIISNLTGKSVDVIKQAFTNAYDMRFLQFRVTYIPMIDARIKQHKSSINDNFGYDNIIQYTQKANIISSQHYGENIKGTVNRFGNDEIIYNLLIPINRWIEQYKELGYYWQDTRYVISQIDLSYYDNVVKLDLHLSKNFNRYSQYVGIDNQFRMYEVSERQAVQRDIVYEEYIAISYDNTLNDIVGNSSNIVRSYCLQNILNSFVDNNTGLNVDSAIISTYDANNSVIAQNIILPVVSIGVGNALYFKFKFNDNYSAGDRVVPQLVNGVLFDEQVYVPYSDYYGAIQSMSINIGRTIAGNLDFNSSYNTGNSLPANTTIQNNILFNFSTNNKVLIEKTGSEIITFSTQINFVGDDTQNIIIGSGITHTNSLVSNQANNYRVYVLPYKLNSNVLYIDTTNLTPLDDVGFSANDITIDTIGGAIIGRITKTYTYSGSSGISMQSWAIIDKNTGYFILGRNMYITNGTEITFPNFYPARTLKYKRSENN